MRAAIRALALVVPLSLAACAKGDFHTSARRAPAATTVDTRGGEARGPASPVARHAALEITVSLRADVDDTSHARQVGDALARFTEAHGGWVSARNGSPDSVTLQLRVPPSELDALRSLLTRAHGVGALHEQTRAVDVTDALADVDARLHAARATEVRLLALLDQRTGSLADVLAVERSLGDARARIEQLEAEARNAHGRVDLATVDLELTVSRDVLPATLPAQARVALHDGVVGARTMVSVLLLFVLRVGPSLALLGLPVWAFLWLRRRSAPRLR